ncbi:MAG: glycosyltransferase family 2 protein [Phycisphaeraceae bacterium]
MKMVSVIISAYNPGPYLQPALRSVLEQTYPHLEIIVVDDGSTDGSVLAAKEQVDDARVRWLHQSNAGKPTAMNRALRACRGDYYMVQDADDLSHAERVQRLVETLEAHPDVAAVFSGHELIMKGRRVAPRFAAKDAEACRRDIERLRMPAHDPTGMYRLSRVRDIAYETDLPVVEGYDYILRVGEQFPLMVLGECLYAYRVHEGSVTRANVERREQYVRRVHERARARRSQPAPPELVNGKRRGWKSRWTRDDNNLAAHFMASVLDLRSAGRRLEAVQTGLFCSQLHPLDPHYYKALAYATLPLALVRRLRRSA